MSVHRQLLRESSLFAGLDDADEIANAKTRELHLVCGQRLRRRTAAAQCLHDRGDAVRVGGDRGRGPRGRGDAAALATPLHDACGAAFDSRGRLVTVERGDAPAFVFLSSQRRSLSAIVAERAWVSRLARRSARARQGHNDADSHRSLAPVAVPVIESVFPVPEPTVHFTSAVPAGPLNCAAFGAALPDRMR